MSSFSKNQSHFKDINMNQNGISPYYVDGYTYAFMPKDAARLEPEFSGNKDEFDDFLKKNHIHPYFVRNDIKTVEPGTLEDSLFEAIQDNDLKVVQDLLFKSANPLARDSHGNNAFQQYALNIHLQDIDSLASIDEYIFPFEKEDAYTSVEIGSEQGLSALDIAKNKYIETINNKNIVAAVRTKQNLIYMGKMSNYEDDINDFLIEADKKIATNFVLDKLKAAGIEIVTDKTEFTKILENEKDLQKIQSNLEKLKKLSTKVESVKKAVADQNSQAQNLNEEEKKVADFSFEEFTNEIQAYEKIIPVNNFCPIGNYFLSNSSENYTQVLDNSIKLKEFIFPEDSKESDFTLYLTKSSDNHLLLSYCIPNIVTTILNDGSKIKKILNTNFWNLYDLHTHQMFPGHTQAGYKTNVDTLNKIKLEFARTDFIPEIQKNLREKLKSLEIKQKEILETLIKSNLNKKEFIDNKLEIINITEKKRAEKILETWLADADKIEESLWNKNQLQIRKLYLESNKEERKAVAIISEDVMSSLFNSIKDPHLYADKSCITDYYINRYHNVRTFLNIQNIIETSKDIFFDNEQEAVVFLKKYGKMADCIFVRAENNELILSSITFDQPIERFQNGVNKGRYKNITPTNRQEQEISLADDTATSYIKENSNIAFSEPMSISEHKANENSSILVTSMQTEEVNKSLQIKHPKDIVPLLTNFAKEEVENFGVILLNASHFVKEVKSVSVGTVNKSLVHPREVFKEAIRTNSSALILFHNHPSGNTNPSLEDFNVTKRLLKASEITGIQILDHIIVSPTGYTSFVESNIFDFSHNEEFMKQGNTTYGFTHNGKIYLNPEIMNSNVAVHEYTHLWDKFTQNTNPDLWEKGKTVFSKTHLWEDVKNDPNYADIAYDDDLVLSECHARICGEIAEKVLERIAERDGEIAKNAVIDWDKEVSIYISESLTKDNKEKLFDKAFSIEDAKQFLSQPMKDLISEKNISLKLEPKVTIPQKYVSLVRNLVSKTGDNTMKQILVAGQKALMKFNTEEKSVIRDYLTSVGGVDSQSVGKFLSKIINKKNIETSKHYKNQKNKSEGICR